MERRAPHAASVTMPRTGLAKLAEGEGIEPSTFRWRGFQDRVSTLLATLQNLVPPVGFEPTASGLQNHCSTTELQGQDWIPIAS